MKELKNILLAEDEFDIQRIIKIALERIGGFNVTIVSSGKEAVTVLDSFIPDLLVSDIMMPEMNGIELAKYISHEFNWLHLHIKHFEEIATKRKKTGKAKKRKRDGNAKKNAKNKKDNAQKNIENLKKMPYMLTDGG